MKIYIAHRYTCDSPPFNGDVLHVLHSIGKAAQVGVEVASLGDFPYVPHLDWLIVAMDGALGETIPKSYYYDNSMEWLKVCDAMLVIDPEDLTRSKGVCREYQYCLEHDIPVFKSCKEYKVFVARCEEERHV